MQSGDTEIAIWTVANGAHTRYTAAQVSLEKDLEALLERKGDMIQTGLHIVGRQIRLEQGRLDLLGLDAFGRWAVIELKRSKVLPETVGQAFRYGAQLVDMPAAVLREIVENYLTKQGQSIATLLDHLHLDESVFNPPHDVQIFVVGTARDPHFDQVAQYASFKGNPITTVTFDVFKSEAGEYLLMRRLTELETSSASTSDDTGSAATPLPAAPAVNRTPELDNHLVKATRNGIGDTFRSIYDAALKHGLYPRNYATSIMYTPPHNRNRVLLCAWDEPVRKKLKLAVATSAFAEFYPISVREVEKLLGRERHRLLTPAEARDFATRLNQVFAKIAENEKEAPKKQKGFLERFFS